MGKMKLENSKTRTHNKKGRTQYVNQQRKMLRFKIWVSLIAITLITGFNMGLTGGIMGNHHAIDVIRVQLDGRNRDMTNLNFRLMGILIHRAEINLWIQIENFDESDSLFSSFLPDSILNSMDSSYLDITIEKFNQYLRKETQEFETRISEEYFILDSFYLAWVQ